MCWGGGGCGEGWSLGEVERGRVAGSYCTTPPPCLGKGGWLGPVPLVRAGHPVRPGPDVVQLGPVARHVGTTAPSLQCSIWNQAARAGAAASMSSRGLPSGLACFGAQPLSGGGDGAHQQRRAQGSRSWTLGSLCWGRRDCCGLGRSRLCCSLGGFLWLTSHPVVPDKGYWLLVWYLPSPGASESGQGGGDRLG